MEPPDPINNAQNRFNVLKLAVELAVAYGTDNDDAVAYAKRFMAYIETGE